MSLEVIAALANIEHGNEKNTILETIGSEVENFHVFKFVPEQGQYYASVNWRGIISDTANLATIATLIWTIYTVKVEPKLTNESGTGSASPFVLIQIKDSNKNYIQFNINGNYESKEIFIEEFTSKITKLRHSKVDGEDLLEIYEKSERWMKVESSNKYEETNNLP